MNYESSRKQKRDEKKQIVALDFQLHNSGSEPFTRLLFMKLKMNSICSPFSSRGLAN